MVTGDFRIDLQTAARDNNASLAVTTLRRVLLEHGVETLVVIMNTLADSERSWCMRFVWVSEGSDGKFYGSVPDPVTA